MTVINHACWSADTPIIYVSTGGTRDMPASETAQLFFKSGIKNIELSGGEHQEAVARRLMELTNCMNFQVHNYFPPPQKPFVFNLASLCSDVLDQSLSHALNGMRLASELGRPLYSFHAGFRIDPPVSQLGKSFSALELAPYQDALDVFERSVLFLAEEGVRIGVDLLVENNVITHANLLKYKENPLLLTHVDEIQWFFEKMPGNVRLLLDVAHLKVSSTTLGLCLKSQHKALHPLIRGYHLSDNDGLVDSNLPITLDSWFWDTLKFDSEFFTIEVYGADADFLHQQVALVEGKLKSQ
jgi:sugar phosphate isomerase/epimerase